MITFKLLRHNALYKNLLKFGFRLSIIVTDLICYVSLLLINFDIFKQVQLLTIAI